MWSRIAGALAIVACVAGCTTLPNTPATAPSTTSVTTSTTEATTTTVEPATTTTLDRIAEIEAIFLDLEHRRLQAILDQDEEAYRAVFSNEYYEEESMIVFDTVEVIDPEATVVSVDSLLWDTDSCIAVAVEIDQGAAIELGGRGRYEVVLENVDGQWGLSWTGSGWICDRPHPLQP